MQLSAGHLYRQNITEEMERKKRRIWNVANEQKLVPDPYQVQTRPEQEEESNPELKTENDFSFRHRFDAQCGWGEGVEQLIGQRTDHSH